MKIDDILKKCIETPGISIKSSETSTELLFKSTSGKGSMTFYSLFPGFNLAYIFVNSPIWPAPDFHENGSNATGPLLFNYCVTGRCEIVLNNGNYVYLKDNNLSFTEHFAQSQYQYPRHIYEGLEFFIDLTTIANENTWLLREFGIDFHQIVKHYCPEESTYISPAPAEAETILKKLWELFDLPDSVAVTQMKIYSLALFSYLQNLHIYLHLFCSLCCRNSIIVKVWQLRPHLQSVCGTPGPLPLCSVPVFQKSVPLSAPYPSSGLPGRNITRPAH